MVAPHPDDETLGAAGVMQRVLEGGGTVRVVLLTAGDGYVEAVVHETGLPRPRPAQYIAYGERRLHEARAALETLGQHLKLDFLGFPDGGLDGLLRTHWRRTHPERSRTTGASDPPYPEALEPDVPYDGADLRRELVRLLADTHPTTIIFPDPLDKHPDHHAAGLFTLIALHDWLDRAAATGHAPAPPRCLAYVIHWPDWPPGWNAATPAAGATDTRLELPPTLPQHGLGRVAVTLTDAEVAAKAAALAKYQSQREEMSPLLGAFVRRTEPFTVLGTTEPRDIGAMIQSKRGPR